MTTTATVRAYLTLLRYIFGPSVLSKADAKRLAEDEKERLER